MKLLNSIEFDKFLSSLTLAYCTSASTHAVISTMSLKLNQWPPGNPRDVLNFFVDRERQNNFHVAYYATHERYFDYKILKDNCFEEISDDITELQTILDFNLKAYWSKKIAEEIVKNPANCDELISKLNNISAQTDSTVEYTVDGFLLETIEKNMEQAKIGKNMVLIPEFRVFSEAIGGFNGARVSGLSAASGFGKTKFAVNLADSARKVMPVYYFNMEMNAEDFESQFIQMAANINYQYYKTAKYTENQAQQQAILSYKASFENTHKITFTDGKSLNIDQICSRILVKMQAGGLVICDYDQKIIAGQGEEWLTMVRSIEKLEAAAKKTNAHILVLFQADGDGFAKSSKRAIQPLSSFTHFTKNDQNQYYLKNIKNRFGKTGFEIGLDFFPDTTKVIETGYRALPEIQNTRSVLRR